MPISGFLNAGFEEYLCFKFRVHKEVMCSGLLSLPSDPVRLRACFVIPTTSQSVIEPQHLMNEAPVIKCC